VSEILGRWRAMVVGVVGEQMDCLRCVGRVGRRRAEIAGRFAAGHGGLAAQLHNRAQLAQ
jgi:hypothetical protein